VKITRIFDFKMAAVHHLGFVGLGHIFGLPTLHEYLVVFIVVKNSFAIDLVVSII